MGIVDEVACVVIGRNEGARLHRCLEVLSTTGVRIVYVDSGSTDGSLDTARALGVDALALDASRPFTAARARNAGLLRLLSDTPFLPYVQFIDGDCEPVRGWLEAALARLNERPALGAACGRRRERHPEASVWNRILDVEWDTPIGDTRACGGDAMFRVRALTEVGGFDATMIAGEEPELCERLRDAGWSIERLDVEMTLHDAAMTHFGQWWIRAIRSGHACAEAAARVTADDDAHYALRRVVAWGGLLPLVTVASAAPTGGTSLALLAAYPWSAYRVYRKVRRRGRTRRDAAPYALAITLGKFAEFEGVVQAWSARRRGVRRALIEYR